MSFKYFSPLRTPHISHKKRLQESETDLSDEPDRTDRKNTVKQTMTGKLKGKESKRKSSETSVKSGTELSVRVSPRKKSKLMHTPPAVVPSSIAGSDPSDTETDVDRALSKFADKIRSRILHSTDSDNESDVIPDMDCTKDFKSPPAKGSSSKSPASSASSSKKLLHAKSSPKSAKKKLALTSKSVHDKSESEDSDNSPDEESHSTSIAASPSQKFPHAVPTAKLPSPEKKVIAVSKFKQELSEEEDSDDSDAGEGCYEIPKLRKSAPEEYVPVDFKEYRPEVYAEDLKSEDMELVLVTVPFGFDIKTLNRQHLSISEEKGTKKSMDDDQNVIKKDEEGMTWKSSTRKLKKDDKINDFTPLLPSKKTGHLLPAKPFSYQVTFSASFEIPQLPDPVIPPEPNFQIPTGLKYRNQPFGCLEEVPVPGKKRTQKNIEAPEQSVQSPKRGKKHQRESAPPNETEKVKKKHTKKKSRK